MPAAPASSPVFVDPSGRRRRWVRRTAYVFGFAGVAYTALVGISFAGGPVRPETIIPFVEPTTRPWQPPAPAQPVAEFEPAVGSTGAPGPGAPAPGSIDPQPVVAVATPDAPPATAVPTPLTPLPSSGRPGGPPAGTPPAVPPDNPTSTPTTAPPVDNTPTDAPPATSSPEEPPDAPEVTDTP